VQVRCLPLPLLLPVPAPSAAAAALQTGCTGLRSKQTMLAAYALHCLPQHSILRAPCIDALHCIVSCTASCRLVLQVGEILADIHVEGGEGDLELHSPPAAAAAEAAGGGGPAAHQQQHRGDPHAPGTGAAVGCWLSGGSGLQQSSACSMHAFTAMSALL
jgi:hypothetical protein